MFLSIFCLDDLSIGVSGVLMSPAFIVLLSVSPFMSVSVCLMYWGAPILGAPQYIKQKLTDIKGEIDSNTIIIEY